MLKGLALAARDRKRLQDIAGVFIRFGLEDLMRVSGLQKLLSRDDPPANDYPTRVVAALEELGPTFVKLGQILATRADLLPPPWVAALGRLHNNATPLDYELIRAQIIEDLGGTPEEIFDEFSPVPIASASIAQIYRARLKTGEDIILKVQRGDIAPVIEADIRILSHAAAVAESQMPSLKRYHLAEIVRMVGGAMREELDFTREGHNAEEIAAQFADQPDIVIPKIYWDYCTRRLLAQQYIEGYKPENPEILRAAGLDPERLAQRGTDAVLQMIFVDGVFHGDPHPGNILCLADNKVGFIDFGMIGRISPKRRDELLGLIDAIAQEDGDRVRDILLKWSGSTVTDAEVLGADASQFVARHRKPPLNFSLAITDFMELARRHDLTMPSDTALLFKALVTAEGVARRLDPDIDVIAQARPIAQKVLMPALDVEGLKKMGMGLLAEGRFLTTELPQATRSLIRVAQRGRVPVDVEIGGMKTWMQTIEHAATRLAVGVVVAAFALGLAPQLFTVDREMLGYPLFTSLGLVAVLGGFIWLIASGKRK